VHRIQLANYQSIGLPLKQKSFITTVVTYAAQADGSNCPPGHRLLGLLQIIGTVCPAANEKQKGQNRAFELHHVSCSCR
jgi:hypothetical protein